jgi:D-amino-acid dehydrogenase
LRVIVLGAGVIGATTAYTLAADSHEVVVLDRQPEAGLETSFANGGLITPATSDSWAAPGIPLKILKWLGQDEAPILLRTSAIPGMLRWGVSFLVNCREKQWRDNTRATLALALQSITELRRITELERLSYDRNAPGLLKVFRDADSMNSALRAAELYQQLGVRVEQLDVHSTVVREPALGPVAEHLSGAVFYPDDESGDAFKFTQEICKAAIRRGAEFRLGTAVEQLIREGNRIAGVRTSKGVLAGDAYVLALGSHTPRMARTAGVALQIYPAKGYSITLDAPGWLDAPRIPIADDGLKVAVTPLGGRIRVAGTVEFGGWNTQLNPSRSRMLERSLGAILPNHPAGPLHHWAGLRPLTPGGYPIIGSYGPRNLFINSGHGPLGWTLAAGSARLLANKISAG